MNKLLAAAILIGLLTTTGTMNYKAISMALDKPKVQHYPAQFEYGLQPAHNIVITTNPQGEQLVDWTNTIQNTPAPAYFQGQ